jgi:hypothetical protein
MAVEIKRFQRCRKGALVGFVSVYMSNIGLVINDVAIYDSHKGRFAILPRKPRFDKNGEPVIGQDNYQIQDPIVYFSDKNLGEKFKGMVISALLTAHPDAFDDNAPATGGEDCF